LNILLVRLRQIGDVVFTTPAVGALKSHFPGCRITYVVEPAAAPVVERHPAIDHLIVAPRQGGWRGFLADVKLGRQLRRAQFDMAIDFHGGPRASLLTWLSGAPERIGYEVAGRSWMYTKAVARPRALRARHSVENQWDLLSALGVPAADPARHPVEMPVDPAALGRVRATLSDRRIHPILIVMHVSAGNPFRRWPLTSFAEVAARLATDHDDRLVLVTSGPSEADAADVVVAEARTRLPERAHPRVRAWSRDLSLTDLRGLLEEASLYIGGDSGPMHIAATSRVPMVSLYGPTLPARSAPWRDRRLPAIAIETTGLDCRPCDQRVCLPGDFRCLTRISPSAVVEAAERLLSGADTLGDGSTPASGQLSGN
jgi:lipopolysaccharide heptosyltransferase II